MTMPIHTWEYSENGSQSKVELYADHVLKYFAYQFDKPIRYDFNMVFNSSYPLASLEVDFELLQYLVSLTLEEEFPTNIQPIYAFYKAFDFNKISPDIYEHDTKLSDFAHYYRCLTTYGLEQYYETKDGNWQQSKQRFDRFFFQGPLMSRLPFEMRKRWKEMVWKALGDNPPVALEEGFVLFDYSKIEEKKYSFEKGSFSGEFIEINKGYILIGGWDGRDGGATEYSIENIWYNKFLINNVFSEDIPEIYKNLEAAIVTDNLNETTHNNVSGKEVTQKPESPGEAPPAG